ncbi:MAG: hypothetical protein ACKOWR_04175 [Micrococcales bacterium]
MTETNVTPQIALARVDGLLNKVYVSGLALLTLDLVQNALRQSQFLNPIWFWLTFGALIFSVVGAVLAAFKFGNTRYWYRAMVIVVVFTMLTWGYQMIDNQTLPADYKPWIWWAVGPVTVAAAGAWKPIWAYASLVIAPVLWLVVETSSEGGATPLGLAMQDSLYAFFFSTALVVMALALRDRANEVDRENGKAIQAVLERTRSEVLNRERAIFNSIMHDQVLTTLDLAANATSERSKKLAATAAEDAIGRLNREVDRTAVQPDSFEVSVMGEPLMEAVQRRSTDFQVSLTGKCDLKIPFQAGAAIFEATLLAVSNSLTHAPRASERKVLIRLSQRGIKVVVSDNGTGFRMSNVHKTALGMRWTMFRRLESLGVKPSLESKPGAGTTWIFEWYE